MLQRVQEVDLVRGHQFMPPLDEIEVPVLYSTESVLLDDKRFVLHYFTGSADWWLAELDPTEWLGFGFANLGDPANAEWGYVSLIELGELYLPGEVYTKELPDGGTRVMIQPPTVVERDLYWEPALAVDVLKRFGR
jgi:hypothetical protein